jgi:peptide/nickel transport system permease protein
MSQTQNLPDASFLPTPMTPPADSDRLDALLKEEMSAESKKAGQLAVATPLQLMWWRFRKNRMAVIAAVVLALFYFVALFADVFAPYDPATYDVSLVLSPPKTIHFTDANGNLTAPYVYPWMMETVITNNVPRRVFTEDRDNPTPLGFFVQGEPYRFLGVFEMNLHFFGAQDANTRVYLLGGDDTGRDLFSRIIFAMRISLTISLLGVFITMVLGIVIGGISGYYGGWVDNLTQRIIEFLDAIPKIPLWLGLSAAIPPSWPPLSVFLGIVIILALLEWGGTARTVRSRFLSIRDESYVMAARVAGASERRIIFRHMLPSFYSHMIASVTLRIPGQILGETSLSFLGLGLKAPLISFGILLQDAQNIRSVALAPWLIIPAFFIIVLVLAYNYFGDGLRDAADPYAS